MAIKEQAAMEVANKLKTLAVLFSQPGDLVLTDNEKAGLVGIFDDMAEVLNEQDISG
jgi:hypothetical protein